MIYKQLRQKQLQYKKSQMVYRLRQQITFLSSAHVFKHISEITVLTALILKRKLLIIYINSTIC